MSASALQNIQSQVARQRPGFIVELAAGTEAIRESQALRYDVFAREGGARLHNTRPGLDDDYLDSFCDHLLVRDQTSGQVVASTRILGHEMAAIAGGFYSAGEFDLSQVLRQPGRFMEIGRTCVHADYRNGIAIMHLWQGIAAYLAEHRYDYLMGCASICLKAGDRQAQAILHQLRHQHLSEESMRVTPLQAYPTAPVDVGAKVSMPPLIKAYLRVGAKVCGEPYWDKDFNVADVFVLMPAAQIAERYARHFMQATNEG